MKQHVWIVSVFVHVRFDEVIVLTGCRSDLSLRAFGFLQPSRSWIREPPTGLFLISCMWIFRTFSNVHVSLMPLTHSRARCQVDTKPGPCVKRIDDYDHVSVNDLLPVDPWPQMGLNSHKKFTRIRCFNILEFCLASLKKKKKRAVPHFCLCCSRQKDSSGLK